MSRPSSVAELFRVLARGESPPTSPRVLVLAAHPDDETIGASAFLGRLAERTVMFLTDGAPRDPQFRSPHVTGSREMYALVRAEEAASALALAGVPPERIMFLNGIDQESIGDAQNLLNACVEAAARIEPEIILTHPYEGGHPDHDTAALIASLTRDELRRQGGDTPVVLEFTSYHTHRGRRVSGEFLPSNMEGVDGEEITLKLSPEERARKARMLGCYLSQWHVLSEFPLEPERLRVAPQYDFTRPPHEGPLWYECLHWSMTGAKWRTLAAEIFSQHGEVACR